MTAMVGAQELGRDVEDLIKTPANDALHFGELEREILRLWDAEQEVNLELNLLRAQRNGQPHSCMSDSKY